MRSLLTEHSVDWRNTEVLDFETN